MKISFQLGIYGVLMTLPYCIDSAFLVFPQWHESIYSYRDLVELVKNLDVHLLFLVLGQLFMPIAKDNKYCKYDPYSLILNFEGALTLLVADMFPSLQKYISLIKWNGRDNIQ